MMRGHLPANENTAANFLPIYDDTRQRMATVFGPRPEAFWPATEETCSNCYSLTPALTPTP